VEEVAEGEETNDVEINLNLLEEVVEEVIDEVFDPEEVEEINTFTHNLVKEGMEIGITLGNHLTEELDHLNANVQEEISEIGEYLEYM
jgi:hypothetical protein